MTTDLLTAAQVQNILGCSRSWISRHRVQLGAVRIDGLLRFHRERVAQYTAGTPAVVAAAEPTPIRRTAARPRREGLHPITRRPWSLYERQESTS